MTLLRLDQGKGVRIVATGSYLPPKRITTEELSQAPGAPMTRDEILRLTGIECRRWVNEDQATSDLAVAAGRVIMEKAGVQQVDRLLLSTTSPDHPSPATACLVQHRLGLAPCAAVDLSAACAGFLFALDWGARAVLTGGEHVLALAADVRSRFVDPEDKATFALFGDGAGGALLAPGPKEEGLLALYLAADGEGFDTIMVPAGGSRKPANATTLNQREHFLRMQDGPRVFLTAIEGMTDAASALVKAMGITYDDIDLIVPHQPNRMILDRMARYMRVPIEKFFVHVQHTGNMSSASLAVALDEAWHDPRVRPGSLLLLLGGGAGFCVGAALIRVPEEVG